jgi:tetratricopeptide (TPR) repeat protein
MKRQSMLAVVAMLLFAWSAVPASAQNAGAFRGKVIKDNAPAPDLQVRFTDLQGKQYKAKTDKKGEYFAYGVVVDDYIVEVLASSGEILYTREHLRLSTNETASFDIDLSHPEASRGMAGSSHNVTVDSTGKKLTKEEVAKIKADNEKLMSLNALITQAQSAMQAQKWKEAETALKQLIAAAPDTMHWEFYGALGDTQGRANEYEDAIQSYEKAIPIAQGYVSGQTPRDPKNPFSDPAKAKTGIGQMLAAEGNAYFSLGKSDKAAELFSRAAELSPNPAVAYYNLCATQSNRGETAAALVACEKAIVADPSLANSYYLKGSILYRSGKTEAGKFVAPPGTAEALNKYLELAPNGEHVAEVKAMLVNLGPPPAK